MGSGWLEGSFGSGQEQHGSILGREAKRNGVKVWQETAPHRSSY